MRGAVLYRAARRSRDGRKQTMAYMVCSGIMADKDDIREGKDFGLGVPQQNKAFYVKGSGALDWGMQNRLARIFNPASGKTVMLAFDHGYFQGPTTGLERMDLSIVPLIPACGRADVHARRAAHGDPGVGRPTPWSCAAPAARASHRALARD